MVERLTRELREGSEVAGAIGYGPQLSDLRPHPACGSPGPPDDIVRRPGNRVPCHLQLHRR